jgi:DNA topoisomerase IA
MPDFRYRQTTATRRAEETRFPDCPRKAHRADRDRPVALQKLCGSRFGWPASKTLSVAQELYDGQGKKIITYPVNATRSRRTEHQPTHSLWSIEAAGDRNADA